MYTKQQKKESKIRKLRKSKLPVGLSLQIQLAAVGLDGGVPLVVDVLCWIRCMGSRVRRWVEFIAVGLGWIRHCWVGYSPWFSLAVVRLYSPGWAGFITVRLDSPRLGFTCWLDWLRWVGFIAVRLHSLLLGSHWPLFDCIHPHCTQFSLIPMLVALDSPSLTPLVGVGFNQLRLGLLDVIAIISAWRGLRDSVRSKEKDDQTKNRSWLSSWPVFRDAPLGFLLCGPRTDVSYPWRFPFPLISLDLGQPKKSGVAHIPRGRGGARVGCWRFALKGEMEDEREISRGHGWFLVQTPLSRSEIVLDLDAYSCN